MVPDRGQNPRTVPAATLWTLARIIVKIRFIKNKSAIPIP